MIPKTRMRGVVYFPNVLFLLNN
ncbi:hypothetical protein EMIT051CA3_40419 [Pseudomonas chlororaphis]